MTGAEAVAQIQQGIGFRTDLATQILAALNFAQDEHEQAGFTLPEFLKTSTTLSTATGSTTLLIPSDFIKEVASLEGPLRYPTTATSRAFYATKTGRVVGDSFFLGRLVVDGSTVTSDLEVASGFPQAYALQQTNILVWPIPDAVYNLTFRYYRHDSDIANDSTTNNWLTYHPWVLISEAGWKIAADLQNNAAMQKFSQIGSAANRNLLSSVIEREIAGRRFYLGGRL